MKPRLVPLLTTRPLPAPSFSLSLSFFLILLLLFSHLVLSDSLQPHGVQHARLPCPSLSPEVYSNSCPLSWWCHPTVSSCHPLPLLPSVFPSIKIFSSELALHIRWQKYWSFSISPSNEYSGLISFRIDSFDPLSVQGTFKSLLQHHSFENTNSLALCLLYGPILTAIHATGKTTALTRQTFVKQAMSLLFNMLSRFVIACLPRSKHLLISRLQSLSTVICFI